MKPEPVGAGAGVKMCRQKHVFYFFLTYFYMTRSRSQWKKVPGAGQKRTGSATLHVTHYRKWELPLHSIPSLGKLINVFWFNLFCGCRHNMFAYSSRAVHFSEDCMLLRLNSVGSSILLSADRQWPHIKLISRLPQTQTPVKLKPSHIERIK